jgi:hypothetical protein
VTARVNWRAVRNMVLGAALIVAIGCLPTNAHGYTARVERWRPVLKAAARHYHLSAADTRWGVANGLRIIKRESHGHAGSVNRRSRCTGLFQFIGSWTHRRGQGIAPGHHHRDWRLCGTCSCYRFMRVLKVGGRAKVRQHWSAS